MTPSSNQEYLLTQQYQDGSRLAARARLHARFRTNSYGWPRWLFEHLHMPSQGSVLELGCGPAWLWMRNMDRIPADWNITLTDFSPGMLDEARQNLRESAHPFAFAVVDAQAIPYPDDSFDAVIANHMLYHVPDRPAALAEIRRVLKPGGRFYASTLGANHLRELADVFPDSGFDARHRFSFNLENGGEQLAAHFAQVTLHRYDDALVVTEAEALVAYLLSMSPRASALSEDAHAVLIKRVDERIAVEGPIQLTMDMGMFEAW